MLKIRKLFNVKIISLVVSISFLFTTTLYAYPEPKDTLRLHIGDKHGDDTYSRFQNLGLLQVKQTTSLEEYVAFLNRVAPQIEITAGVSFIGAVEINGRIWLELETEIGILYRVEDIILLQGDYPKFQDYFSRFQEGTTRAQKRITEVQQTILRFSKDDPVAIYLCGDKDSFLSFRDTVPPDWAGVYMAHHGAVVYDWNYISAVFDNREFGGIIFSRDYFGDEATHELTHALICRVIFGGHEEIYAGMRGNEFPCWLEEGFVVSLFQYQGDANLENLVKKRGYLPTLAFLKSPLPKLDKSPIDSNVEYQTCGGFIQILAQEVDGGYDTILVAMQRMVKERIPFEKALLDLTSIDVYEVERKWRRQVTTLSAAPSVEVVPSPDGTLAPHHPVGHTVSSWLGQLKQQGLIVGGELSDRTKQALHKGEPVSLILHIGTKDSPELRDAAKLRDEEGIKAIIIGVDIQYHKDFDYLIERSRKHIAGLSDVLLINADFKTIPDGVVFDEIRIFGAIPLNMGRHEKLDHVFPTRAPEWVKHIYRLLAKNGKLLITTVMIEEDLTIDDGLKKLGLKVEVQRVRREDEFPPEIIYLRGVPELPVAPFQFLIITAQKEDADPSAEAADETGQGGSAVKDTTWELIPGREQASGEGLTAATPLEQLRHRRETLARQVAEEERELFGISDEWKFVPIYEPDNPERGCAKRIKPKYGHPTTIRLNMVHQETEEQMRTDIRHESAHILFTDGLTDMETVANEIERHPSFPDIQRRVAESYERHQGSGHQFAYEASHYATPNEVAALLVSYALSPEEYSGLPYHFFDAFLPEDIEVVRKYLPDKVKDRIVRAVDPAQGLAGGEETATELQVKDERSMSRVFHQTSILSVASMTLPAHGGFFGFEDRVNFGTEDIAIYTRSSLEFLSQGRRLSPDTGIDTQILTVWDVSEELMEPSIGGYSLSPLASCDTFPQSVINFMKDLLKINTDAFEAVPKEELRFLPIKYLNVEETLKLNRGVLSEEEFILLNAVLTQHRNPAAADIVRDMLARRITQRPVKLLRLEETVVFFLDKDIRANPDGFEEALDALDEDNRIVVITDSVDSLTYFCIDNRIDLGRFFIMTPEKLGLAEFDLEQFMRLIDGIDNLRCLPLTDFLCDTYEALKKARDKV